jgi:hypothetical protein
LKVCVALLLCTVVASVYGNEVYVVRHQARVQSQQSDLLGEKVWALLRSCDIDSTGYAASDGAWANAMRADSSIRVMLSVPRRFSAPSKSGTVSRNISEVLVSFPKGALGADHVYAKSDGVVISYTKCHLNYLWQLIEGPPLDLSDEEPYKSLPVEFRKLPK